MSERIITLFGEEIIPEQIKAVGKSRAKKKDKEDEAEEKNEAETATEAVDATPQPEGEVVAEKSIDGVEEPTTEPKKKAAKKDDETKSLELPDDWKGSEKQYLSIGEVAEIFKVKTSHIRFWTNEFKLNVRTTRKGDRLYTNEQIRELRAIHHLVKERGFTLTGAKAKLKTQNKMDVETVDLKKSLLSLRNKLLAIKNQLK